MCGICGKYSPSGVEPQHLNQMLDSLAHRGPDDSGSYVRARIGLGSAAKIIDLQSGRRNQQ
jgi:asparagine synthetase B (glutamine-hydrolysing)